LVYAIGKKRIKVCLLLAISMFFACLGYSGEELAGDYKRTGICAGNEPDTKILFDKRKDYEDEEHKAEANRNTAALLVEEIQKVNLEIEEVAGLIEEKTVEIEEIDKEVLELEEEEKDLLKEIEEAKKGVSYVLKTMYENSGSDDLLSILSRPDADLYILNQEEYVRAVSDYAAVSIERLDLLIQEKANEANELAALRTSKEIEQGDLEQKKKDLETEFQELEALRKEAEEKAESAAQFAEQLKAEVIALEQKEREALLAAGFEVNYSDVTFTGDGSNFYYESPYPYNQSELKLLAGIIQCEAGSQSYPGMIAVGSVVMNRVFDPRFANTIAGVVYAKNQFSPAGSGRLATVLANGPVEPCYQAAKDVLEGKRNVPNFYFKSAWYAEERGIEGVNIGGNVFH